MSKRKQCDSQSKCLKQVVVIDVGQHPNGLLSDFLAILCSYHSNSTSVVLYKLASFVITICVNQKYAIPHKSCDYIYIHNTTASLVLVNDLQTGHTINSSMNLFSGCMNQPEQSQLIPYLLRTAIAAKRKQMLKILCA